MTRTLLRFLSAFAILLVCHAAQAQTGPIPLTFLAPCSNGQVITTSAGVQGCATPSGGGITALTGDVTASGSGSVAATVVKIDGASVPAAGSLTTGNSLGVTGSSTLAYSALNLAGGAGYVTGLLPLANLTLGTIGAPLVGGGSSASSYSTTWGFGTSSGGTTANTVTFNIGGAAAPTNTGLSGGINFGNAATAPTLSFANQGSIYLSGGSLMFTPASSTAPLLTLGPIYSGTGVVAIADSASAPTTPTGQGLMQSVGGQFTWYDESGNHASLGGAVLSLSASIAPGVEAITPGATLGLLTVAGAAGASSSSAAGGVVVESGAATQATSGTAAGGHGGDLLYATGSGANGQGGTSGGGRGGNILEETGAGGAPVSTGTGGAGGLWEAATGAGANGNAGGTNGSGGAIVLNTGAAGTGGTGGAVGIVAIQLGGGTSAKFNSPSASETTTELDIASGGGLALGLMGTGGQLTSGTNVFGLEHGTNMSTCGADVCLQAQSGTGLVLIDPSANSLSLNASLLTSLTTSNPFSIKAGPGLGGASSSVASGNLTLSTQNAAVATSGTAAGGAAGTLELLAGNGAPGLGGTSGGGAAGILELIGGTGGNAISTGTSGAGTVVTIQGGLPGSAASGTTGAAGGVQLTSQGAVAGGVATGAAGTVLATSQATANAYTYTTQLDTTIVSGSHNSQSNQQQRGVCNAHLIGVSATATCAIPHSVSTGEIISYQCLGRTTTIGTTGALSDTSFTSSSTNNPGQSLCSTVAGGTTTCVNMGAGTTISTAGTTANLAGCALASTSNVPTITSASNGAGMVVDGTILWTAIYN